MFLQKQSTTKCGLLMSRPKLMRIKGGYYFPIIQKQLLMVFETKLKML
jgi:hypothetical protein